MPDLTPRDFSEYFAAIHGHAPFPWQERLLHHVAREGHWPSLLDLPTGSGKTASIDIALFLLALDAGSSFEDVRTPRRIVMVVDRRTVVDQGFQRACKIANALRNADGGVLRRVRDRLCSLSNTEEPLVAVQLRGGMPRNDEWALRPDQPVVAMSTVDQVGSRLLFRGYGVSEGMRPIHAGLLGNDALLLLDEVHLSEPFRQTLESLQRYRAWSKRPLPNRWQVVEMSATPGTDTPAFTLTDEDRANPTLARRLRASKPTECHEVKVSGGDDACRTRFAEACIEHANQHVLPGRTVGIVVNRVATAIAIFKLARERWGTPNVHLVTGRMRPLDREDLDHRIASLVASGRVRDPSSAPVVVVSTQCIEAGADYDFDALITECASLDALRQRFGRLNRLGDLETSPGVVLARSDSLRKDKLDPVYGSAMCATWQWLSSSVRDFGIEAMNRSLPEPSALLELLPPRARAPVMLPSHLDSWAQTSPRPRPDPDVGLWLHGVEQKTDLDVQIVWRADLSNELLAAALGPDEDPGTRSAREELLRRVEACPPTGLEALAVPISAARMWLSGLQNRSALRNLDVSDVDGSRAPNEELPTSNDSTRGALWWRGDDSRFVHPQELRPGMTIVVPSGYGGLGGGTWDPSSTEPVGDLGDRGRYVQTGRPTFRLHPAVMEAGWPPPPTPRADDDRLTVDPTEVDSWITAMSEAVSSPWVREAVSALGEYKSRRRCLLFAATGADPESAGYIVLVGRRQSRRGSSEVSSEDDNASYTGVEVTLDDHLNGVRTWAGAFAQRCGLPSSLVADLELAGRWHDAGKVDPRFQRLLRGGSPLADVAIEPLAKSSMVANDRLARIRARERSGYPRGGRHELSSVALLEAGAELLDAATDRELVLHLVASHHGYCRPFAPVVDDPEPLDLVFEGKDHKVTVSSRHGLAALDSGIPSRFWTLIERYGWFGLAWLEAILRLADHRRSEYEQSLAFVLEEKKEAAQ